MINKEKENNSMTQETQTPQQTVDAQATAQTPSETASKRADEKDNKSTSKRTTGSSQSTNTENFAYSWEIITDKTYNDEIESAIQQKITSKEKGLSICSYNDVVEYMESSMNLLFGSLQMLSLLILLFGIINLINMTLSNHQARKQEISTLRSFSYGYY